MSLWIWAWLGLILLSLSAGVIDDLNDGVTVWKVALDLVAWVAAVGLVLVFYLDQGARIPAVLLIIALAFSVGWIIVRGIGELREPVTDEVLSSRDEIWLRVGVTVLIALMIVPAWLLGFASIWVRL